MRVLITGATGLVGSQIVKSCHHLGISVNYLTHHKSKIKKEGNYQGYYYNPSAGEIDPACLNRAGAIINLAGENIAKRWTEKNKNKILNSRLNVTNLLFRLLQENEHKVGNIVSASGISIYPSSETKLYYEEEEQISDSFLSKVLIETEAAADKFKKLGLRVAKIRTGVVLAKNGGALPQMEKPLKYNLGAVLGRGKQWLSWIHIKDIARLYLFVMQHGLEGVFNAVAPNPVTNEELMREIAKARGKKIWLPNVPGFALKLALGEMANTVLESQLVSSKKIQESGFSFMFTNITKALEDIEQ